MEIEMCKFVIPIVMASLVFLGSGCATIVSKSQWPVIINSNPTGANVTIWSSNNKQGMEMQKGITPMTVTLSSKNGFFSPAAYQFTFEKEGYCPATASLSAGMNGWYIGNILFGGLIGLIIVDPATGAMWKLDETVCGNLSPDLNTQVKSSKPEAMPAPSTPQPATLGEDNPARLKKLKELKDAGALTDEEYETKRKAIVDRL